MNGGTDGAVVEELITPDLPREMLEDFLDEQHEAAMVASKDRWERAKLAHLYYLGRQDQWLDKSSMQIRSFWDGQDRMYRQTNHMRPLIDTQVGRMVKALPSVTAKPVTPDALARGAAKLAADYIEYQEFEHSLDRTHAKVTLNGILHGCAGYKVFFSPERDANVWEPITLFDFLIDPNAADQQSAEWVTFISHRDKWSAHKLANRYSRPGEEIPLSEIQETSYTPGVTGTERSGVEVMEHWHKPSARVPDGLYAVTVGGRLAYVRAYPYMLAGRDSPEERSAYLPLVLWSPGDGDHGVLGSTPVDDVVHIQRDLNERESHYAHLIKVSSDLKVIIPSAIYSKFTTGKSSRIEGEPSQMPAWMQPPSINPALFRELERGPEQIADVLGVNSLVSGNTDPKSGQSARSLAYVDELDSLKIALGHRSLQDMIEAGFELDLKLAQTFFTGRIEKHMPGADGIKAVAFEGADLQGVTVRLEPRSGMERFSDSKAYAMQEMASAGLPVDPQGVVSAMQTGQAETSQAAAAKRIALADAKAVLRGQPPSLQADPRVAVQVLADAFEVAQARQVPGAEKVRELAKLYMQRLQQMQAAQPQQPAQQPQGQK